MLLGVWHCRANAYNNLLVCKDSLCTFSSTKTGVSYSFSRSDLLNAESVRVRKSTGEYVEPSTTRSKSSASRGLGYSLRIRVRESSLTGAPNGFQQLPTDKHIMFTDYDMGRRMSRKHASTIGRYISTKSDKESDEPSAKEPELNISNGKSVTALGLVAMFLGFVSLLMACAMGEFQDTTPRRLKKHT